MYHYLKKAFEMNDRFGYANVERLKYNQVRKEQRCKHISSTFHSIIKDEKRAK